MLLPFIINSAQLSVSFYDSLNPLWSNALGVSSASLRSKELPGRGDVIRVSLSGRYDSRQIFQERTRKVQGHYILFSDFNIGRPAQKSSYVDTVSQKNDREKLGNVVI